MISSLQFAGHSAFFIENGSEIIAIDPWLEGNPSTPEALKDPKRIDQILLTHGHSDHSGGVVALAKKHNAVVHGAVELIAAMQRDGLPEELGVAFNIGGTIKVSNLNVTMTIARHSSSYEIDRVAQYAGEPSGFVISDGTNCIYHAGDTSYFSEMKMIAQLYSPNIAILPIGDYFTMGPKEAALAAKEIGARITIPMHHSTFPLLTGKVQDFANQCQNLDIDTELRALQPGESLSL